MKAIGLNFADVYRRKGNYHLEGQPPYVLGYEGAGIVEQLGSDVTEIQVGQRIAFADVPFANAELVAVPVEKAIPIPETISLEEASSVLLQGLTAHYLTKDSYAVQKGDVVLVHAAAGGVGFSGASGTLHRSGSDAARSAPEIDGGGNAGGCSRRHDLLA